MNSAVIIPVGDELLNGSVTDTNSAWIASRLFLSGIGVKRILCVGDTMEELLSAITLASQIADIIIITGGLGPTKDDVTKHALCIWSDSALKRDEPSYQRIRHYMEARGRDVNSLNASQADVPTACRVLPNINGTAPGMWFDLNGKTLISLPGVPYEMKAIVEDFVLQDLQSRYSDSLILESSLLVSGVPESELALLLEGFESDLPNRLQIGYLPEPGLVKLKLRMLSSPVHKSTDLILLNTWIDTAANIIGTAVFGRNEDTLESVIVSGLRLAGKTLAIAESCTGGNIGSMLVSVPGASDVFVGGVISYSNEMKISLLGVDAKILHTHGAVSEAVACAMAVGVRKLSQSDYGLSVTGIAGPDGGSIDKPVGTVWIGIADSAGVQAFYFRFEQHRMRNIRKASLAALDILRKKHWGFLGKGSN
jgi:nicotinamide-nucleotide amidase